MNNRKPGYYKCRMGTNWYIREWDGMYWDSITHTKALFDYWHEVIETPISPEPVVVTEIVTICGSGRFLKEMHEVEERLTLKGKIVLMIGVNTKDVARTAELEHYKPMLDELHKRKIDISTSVFVVNPGGYIGESTRNEIEYSKQIGKPIEYLVVNPE